MKNSKDSKVRFGYASAPEAISLQTQVEALEDVKIPAENIYAEIVNPGHPERAQFNCLLTRAHAGDSIVIVDFSAIGSDLLDVCGRIDILDEKGIKIEILDLAGWASQESMMDAFQNFGALFQKQRDLIPAAGKPRKPYPLGWRDAYRRYMDGESTAQEICSELNIKLYDFYRMRSRYADELKARKKKKKANNR